MHIAFQNELLSVRYGQFQPLHGAAPGYARDLRVGVFQREIQVTRTRQRRLRHLARDADAGELAFQCIFYLKGEFADGDLGHAPR